MNRRSFLQILAAAASCAGSGVKAIAPPVVAPLPPAARWLKVPMIALDVDVRSDMDMVSFDQIGADYPSALGTFRSEGSVQLVGFHRVFAGDTTAVRIKLDSTSMFSFDAIIERASMRSQGDLRETELDFVILKMPRDNYRPRHHFELIPHRP